MADEHYTIEYSPDDPFDPRSPVTISLHIDGEKKGSIRVTEDGEMRLRAVKFVSSGDALAVTAVAHMLRVVANTMRRKQS